MELCHRRVIKG